jgi:site-specific recombinase XerD
MPSVKQASEEFLRACEADGFSAATISWYRSLLSVFAEQHGHRLLATISTSDMRAYLISLKERYASPDTLSAHNRALHRFWSWCVEEYEVSNPMRSIRYPRKPEPKPKAIDADDVAAMFRSCGDDPAGVRNRALLAFLWDTGCRAGGLLGLKVEDVQLDQRRALVTEKGRRTRVIVFTSFTADLLTSWYAIGKPSEWVFYNMDTQAQLTASGLRGILKRIAHRAHVTGRVNPHSFRHGFAREYLDAGGDMNTLSKLMGHRDVSTTLAHYIYFTAKEVALKHEQLSPVRKLPNGDKK